jgi:hypothetical protein
MTTDRPWEVTGTREIGAVERQALDRLGGQLVPQRTEPVTWAQIEALLDQYADTPHGRRLRCGRAVWEHLRSGDNDAAAVLAVDAGVFGFAGPYGTPVHVDADMPDGAWKIVDGDQIVAEGDLAPGFRRVAYLGDYLIGFNPPEGWQS